MIPPSSRNPAPAIVDTSAGVPHPRRFGQVGAASPANDQKAPLLSGGAFLTHHNLPQLVFPAPPRSSINVVDIGAIPASKSEYIDAAVTFASPNSILFRTAGPYPWPDSVIARKRSHGRFAPPSGPRLADA